MEQLRNEYLETKRKLKQQRSADNRATKSANRNSPQALDFSKSVLPGEESLDDLLNNNLFHHLEYSHKESDFLLPRKIHDAENSWSLDDKDDKFDEQRPKSIYLETGTIKIKEEPKAEELSDPSEWGFDDNIIGAEEKILSQEAEFRTPDSEANMATIKEFLCNTHDLEAGVMP